MSVLKGPLRRLTYHWVISPAPSGAGVIISVSCLVDHLFAPFIKTLMLLSPRAQGGDRVGPGNPMPAFAERSPLSVPGHPSHWS